MIEENYVSFEIAKLLKEKGFDEGCRACYGSAGSFCYKKYEIEASECEIHNYLLAPTLQMAMKWLREVHNINIDIVPIWNQKRFEYQVFVVTPENAKHCYIDDKLYLGYEQSCEAALEYCLENLI